MIIDNNVEKVIHERKIRRLRKEYSRKNWFKNLLERVIKLFKR